MNTVFILLFFACICYTECARSAEQAIPSLFLLRVFYKESNCVNLKPGKMSETLHTGTIQVPEEPGLYLITASPSSTTFTDFKAKIRDFNRWPTFLPDIKPYYDVYPLYVGETKNLRKRMKEHMNDVLSATGFWSEFKGKLKKQVSFFSKEQTFDVDGVFVCYIPMTNKMNAKWMESVFLSIFDFPNNIEEQDKSNVRILMESGLFNRDSLANKDADRPIKVEQYRNVVLAFMKALTNAIEPLVRQIFKFDDLLLNELSY